MVWHHPYPVVDTHVHAGLRLYEPIESLVDQLFRHGVDQAVLVQQGGEFDNTYLIESARRFPGRFVVAALVDTRLPDAPDTLARWCAAPEVRGLRLRCTDPEPVWRQVNDLSLVASLSGGVADLAAPETRRLIEASPGATFCIEHLGLPNPDEAPPYETYRRALALAELPNVFLKVSGFYAFTRETYPYGDVARFADLALAAFGPRRMTWASDFPPISSHEGYHNGLGFMATLYADLSTDERAWLMGRTARQAWRLEPNII